MTSYSRLRLAVVGCGAVARLYHLPAIAASDDVELVALVDPALDRARALADRYSGARAVKSVDELEGLVDAVVVATPNRFHAPVASSLLRAGIHTLVEKPLARTTAECDAIAAAASESGAVVAVGHDFRAFPIAAYTKSLVDAGVLGSVEHVDLRQSQTGGWPSETTSVFSQEESGGGVLIDFGVHMLDLLRWWLGDLRVLSYCDDNAGGVETDCEIELETSAGVPVRIALSRLRELRGTFVIRCANAAAEIGIFEPATLRLSLPAGGTLEGDVANEEFNRAPLLWVFGRQLASFVRAIRTGSEPLVTLADGREAVALVEVCYAQRRPLQRQWDWPEALAATGAGT